MVMKEEDIQFYNIKKEDTEENEQLRVCIECISNDDDYCLNFKKACHACKGVCNIIMNDKAKYYSF